MSSPTSSVEDDPYDAKFRTIFSHPDGTFVSVLPGRLPFKDQFGQTIGQAIINHTTNEIYGVIDLSDPAGRQFYDNIIAVDLTEFSISAKQTPATETKEH